MSKVKSPEELTKNPRNHRIDYGFFIDVSRLRLYKPRNLGARFRKYWNTLVLLTTT